METSRSRAAVAPVAAMNAATAIRKLARRTRAGEPFDGSAGCLPRPERARRTVAAFMASCALPGGTSTAVFTRPKPLTRAGIPGWGCYVVAKAASLISTGLLSSSAISFAFSSTVGSTLRA